MSDVWLATATASGITHSGPTSGLDTAQGETAVYIFAAVDFGSDSAGNLIYPALKISSAIHSSGVYQTREAWGFWSNANGAGQINEISFVLGAPCGGEFVAGGVLSITKDEGAHTYTYQGVLGSHVF